MNDEIKRIDIREFREAGFLQEVNRKFFHPLGLALEILIDFDEKKYSKSIEDPDAKYTLGGIWDYRDDPEGMFYGNGSKEDKHICNAHIERVEKIRLSKIEARKKASDVVVDDNGTQIFRHWTPK